MILGEPWFSFLGDKCPVQSRGHMMVACGVLRKRQIVFQSGCPFQIPIKAFSLIFRVVFFLTVLTLNLSILHFPNIANLSGDLGNHSFLFIALVF